MFVCKALNGLASPYLSEHLTIRRPSRSLQPSALVLLDVPRSYQQLGDRSFAVTAPELWNSVLPDVHMITVLV